MEEEFQGEPTLGGHNFVFIDELSPGQACPICLLAMRRPVQTVCGHRFCHICLLESFRECAVPVCPEDRNRIPQNAGFFPDMAWERDILSLRVKCKRSERGCDWTGQLRHYEEHFSICQYEDVTCGDCEEEMQRGFLYGHTTSECPQRIVQCAHCNEEFAFSFTKFHEEECGRFPLECSQGCGSQIPREELNSHLRDDCGMTMVVCSYQGAGCTFYDKRNQLENHLEIGRKEHLSKTWSRLRELKNENSSMRKLLDRKSGEMNELQRQLEEVRFTASNDQVEIGQLKHLVFTMCLEGMDDRLEHPTRKSKGILEKFKIRKPRSSRQEQNGKKENPFMERSWSSMRNLSHPSSQK